MEKNKNRTDLLAAGRKKLQQYRQKKDGKGSKSFKAGKSNSDGSANAASAANEQPEVNIQVPDLEISVSDTSKGLAEVLTLQSREESEASDADVATSPPPLPALPGTGLAEVTLTTTSELPSEDSAVFEAERRNDSSASNNDGSISGINTSMEIKSSPETLETNVGMPVPVDLLDAPNFANANAVKVDLVHGEDQVPDVGAEQEAESSSFNQAEVEVDRKPALSQLDENTEALEETSSGHSVSVLSGATAEIKEVRKEDEDDPVSSQSLVASDVSSTRSPEPSIQQREDLTVGPSSESGGFRSERFQADTSQKTVHMESKAGSVEDMGSISLSQLAEVVKGLGEDDFRFLLTARESATNEQLRNTSGLSIQERGFSDVWARIEEHFYLTNLEKDVFHLQLVEELELKKEFDRQHHQLVNEISIVSASRDEFKGKNESLADELERCRSKLQVVALERDDLQKQFHFAKAECEELSARADDLQFRLESSQKELAECSNLVAGLRIENLNLDESLTLMAEERRKAEEEKEKLVVEFRECRASLDLLEEEKKAYVSNNDMLLTDLADSKDLATALQVENGNLNNFLNSLRESGEKLDEEKEKLLTELMGCKRSVESLQMEIANLNESLISMTEERRKVEEEKDTFVLENEKLVVELRECRASLELLEEEKKAYVSNNDKLLTGLADSKDLAKALQVENENLNNILTSITESGEKLDEEKEKLSTELMGCKRLVESLEKEIVNLNESLAWEMEGRAKLQEEKGYFANENAKLLTEVAELKGKIDDLKDATLRVEQLTGENASLSNNLNLYKAKIRKIDNPQLSSLSMEAVDPVESLPLGWHKLVDSFQFADLKGHLEQADKVVQKLEKAIEVMHSHSASSSRSSGKAGPPGVSKLIQAFESQGHNDDEEKLEEVPFTENQLSDDPYMFAKEEALNLKAVLKELALDVEKANEMFEVAQSSSLEEAKVELVVLYEIIKQHVHEIEAKKDELLVLYEAIIHEDTVLKAEKTELELNLTECRSRVDELQTQLNLLHQSSDEKASILEEERNSTVVLILKEVGKLDACIGTVGPTNTVDFGTRVAASIDAASKLIENLQEKAEAARRDHESLCGLYREVNEKCNDLHGENELATGILRKIYVNLSKLVNGSYGRVEESEPDMQNEKLLDSLQFGDFDSLMEKLAKQLGDGLELVSVNDKLNTDIGELKKRGLGTDFILKLVEDVKGVVELKGTDFYSDEPASCVESLINFLLKKCKEADEELGMKERSLNELQGEKDQLSFSIVQHENKILVLRESLKRATEDLEAVRLNVQEKVAELEQSEQRVSSLREKLSIAVTKGKGLIVQRDGLKHSLAETSNELERCLQELQVKDSMLHEVETKLKSYSEAGERVEALESELSYIRNSATAIRESFLLKDSVLQRIEEILEDLELPENILARDIIEKVEWLVRSVTGNSLPRTDWDPEGSMGGGSYSDSGFVVMDAWKEDSQQTSNSGDDLRRKYEDLQSKFYELAEQNEMLEQSLKERNNLVQRWEEVLDKINMPAQFRSMEPEDRIEWLGGAFSEAVHHCNSLEQKVDKSEGFCESLTADLEESQRRISDLEGAFQSVKTEKEHLSRSLEILSSDYDKVLDKAQFFDVENDKLQNEATALQEKLEESQRKISDLEAACQLVTGDNNKLQDEITALQQKIDQRLEVDEHLHHVEGEISRLQGLVSDALQDSNTEDLVLGTSATEGLEVLLKKLLEKSTNLSSGKIIPRDAIDEPVTEEANAIHDEKRIRDTEEAAAMKKELEEALGDLMRLKEEKDKYVEANQSLVREVERLDTKRQELQELLNQEEQKSASAREKLNLAVRKGKSLVQQRDGMRQTIDEVTSEVELLKSEIKLRENALSEYQKRMEAVEAERLFFRNRLAETESDLQEKGQTLSMILRALAEIDVDSEFRVSDPVEKIVQIRRRYDDLHVAVASSENDARKSKRAAELLLAELNEVQERNDALQEEVTNADNEISELRKQIYSVEAEKREALSHVEKLYAVNSEERQKEVGELMALKSGADQLKKGFFDVKPLLGDALSKDLEFLHSLEAGMMSSLRSSDAPNLVSPSLSGSVFPSSETKENFLSLKYFSDSKIQEHSKYSVSEICSSIGQNLQDIMKEIGAFREILYNHSLSVQGEANVLSEIVASFHQEITSRKNSYESMKGDIIRLESIARERDAENVVMRRSVSFLYEACKSSVIEMGNLKSQLVGNGFLDGRLRFTVGSITSVDGDNLFSVQTLSSSEEFVRAMADSLLSAVNDFVITQPEILEASQKEMKSTISNLQKELQEKDIQKDRICVELVGQIKAAEATAASYLQELQPSKARILDLEKRVNELQDRESTLKDLEQREKSLTDVLAAKEQEIEALMQALDEEEAQMEDMRNKIEELEGVVQQKNIDLENTEASRLKATKKLSITVNKFDELHSLSANLLSEVEKLQSQLQERDSEISFLRQEVTRCTNDALVSSQMNSKRDSDEINDLVNWLGSMVSQLQVVPDVNFDAEKSNLVDEYKEVLQKKIVSVVSELEDLRANAQSRDNLLQAERSRRESLENSLREKESQLTMLQGDPGQSEITEVEPVINKWTVPGPTSIATQVRSLRKVNNNDQVAIAVDMEPDSESRLLEDEDDDKAHGFKSLTTSKIVPRFMRPVSNVIDGLWVSCDRALMRQPALRLGVIIYWVVMHALLAAFVV